jgi:hypothetical protein
MYLNILYSGALLCVGCGTSLLSNPWRRRIYYDQSRRQFCSTRCKWEHVYREECAIPGRRPTVPGAWDWACRKALEQNGNLCEECRDEIAEIKWFPLRDWLGGKIITNYRPHLCQKNNVEYHHRIPITAGGNSLPENLEVLCHKCHRSNRHSKSGNRKARNRNLSLSVFTS